MSEKALPVSSLRQMAFSEMAERLKTNADAKFGGCFVIVPPGDPAKPISVLILDSKEDPSIFWGAVKTKAEIALLEMEEEEKRLKWGHQR